MTSENLTRWHDYLKDHDRDALWNMLHEDAVFHSPVVHTPQEGRKIVFQYLAAADQVLGSEHFRYVREFDLGTRAMLEFVSEIDGIHINGIDIIEWNEAGQIIDFKVMVRPLKAVNTLHAKMREMLEGQKTNP